MVERKKNILMTWQLFQLKALHLQYISRLNTVQKRKIMDTIGRSTLSIRIRDDIKLQAKALAKEEHRSLSNFIEFLVLNWRDKNRKQKYPVSKNIPNKKTLESMKKTVKGIGLSDVDTSSFESFCDSLELYDDEN